MSIVDPKLKQARDEIHAICQRYDIAGLFVLHNWDSQAPTTERGKAEHWLEVSPSYSKMSVESFDRVRIRSKVADYGGDRAAQQRDLEATVNMVSQLGSIAGRAAVPLLDIAMSLGARFDVEHTPELFEPDPPKGAH